MSAVCGEDPTVVPPQGKIHSAVVEVNGWLYFGTHESYGSATRKYAGAHLIGYELKTGKFRDFGVILPGYTNYSGVAGSAKANCVYIYLIAPGQRNDKPCFLYRVDLATGEKRKVGELPAGGYDAAVYYMFADEDGNCWLPAPNGVLVKYDAAKDKLEKFPGALPMISDFRFKQWMWCGQIPGQNKAAVTTSGGNVLRIFDPEATDKRFRFVAEIGTSGLPCAVAGNTFYWVAEGQAPRLKSLDLSAEKPKIVDHGLITDQDGRKPMRIPALTADAAGAIYMTGDWFTKPRDTATTRLQVDKQGNETYPAQNRCERFAYVKVATTK
jgi:hypothetical protein